MGNREPNLLVDSGLPIFFDPGDAGTLGLPLPDNRHGQSTRVYARSLTVMQKEAVVVNARSGRAWRLASDEGPYLDGFDSAPCPLSFLTTGMVSSYLTEILALAKDRGISVNGVTLVQDNRYTMEGSALKGTMVGGALPVDLEAIIDSPADDATLTTLVADAVAASPLNGLMRGALTSLFSLHLNGKPADAGEIASVEPLDEGDPARLFEGLSPVDGGEPGLIRKTEATDTVHGVAGGAGSSLTATQSRTLHVRGTCRLRPDGSKQIDQELFSPIGSKFRFLSDETEEFGGRGLAPDAVSYMSAGIAFCFMTQLGRYAKILKKNLDSYDVIQDIHFSTGGASAGTGRAGHADPVETHVYLESADGDEFARRALAMGEQTCFLHAFCRTDLKTRVKISR